MTKWTMADIPSLHGRLAVVTGANSGIGWHTALELARAGSEVILASRTEAKGRDAEASAGCRGGVAPVGDRGEPDWPHGASSNPPVRLRGDDVRGAPR